MDFNFQYCQELVKKKDFKTLELYAAEQLKFDRQHSLEKLEFLALSQYFLQKYKNAEINYLKVLNLNPNSLSALVNLARINIYLGKTSVSISYFEKAIAIQKNNTGILNEFGIFLSKQGNFSYAIQIFKDILEYDPKNSIIQYNLALTLKDNFQNIESNELLFQCLDLNPNKHLVLNTIGANFYDIDNFKQAEIYYKKSLEIKPDFLDALINLSILEQSSGNFLTAEKYLFDALKLDPDNGEIHRVISLSKKYTDAEDPHLLSMLSLVAKENSDQNKMLLNFAIAKAYDDIKDFEKASQHYLSGNLLRRKEFQNYNFLDEIKIINNLKKTFSYNYFITRKNLSSLGENIIFILGMPRSGTSLVEQILSSHSKVEGMGELNYLSESMNLYFPQLNYKDFERAMTNANNDVFVSMGENYLEKISRFSKNTDHKIIYTDKNPINYKLIGIIHSCLPKAKIIHCARSPEDTCLSIFKNYFSQNVMPWAYNESELSEYYRAYIGLMDHYSRLIPEFIYSVQYEELVLNSEANIKNLLTFCDLPWQSQCLDFYKNKRNVKTASVSQVREKIHSQSVKGYENYQPYFTKLFKNLKT